MTPGQNRNPATRKKAGAKHVPLKHQHLLRAKFYLQRVGNLSDLFKEVDCFSGDRLSWDLTALNIDPDAWTKGQGTGMKPHRLFCHPDIIRELPRLVAYYRRLASLSAKAVQQLVMSTKNLETGKRSPMPEETRSLARLFNEFISDLIKEGATLENLRIAAYANYGSEVNGSWRNALGVRAFQEVKRLLVEYLRDKGLLNLQILTPEWQRLISSELPPASDKRWALLQSLRCTNNYAIEFGNEPDVAIKDPEGICLGVVEIKGGLDPAGAQERYGAALKSFRKAKEANKNVVTILLMGAITPSVREQEAQEQIVNYLFDLLSVLVPGDEQNRFLDTIRHILRI